MKLLLRWSTLLPVLLSLGGCGLPYYWQALGGQLQILAKRTPIERVIENPDTDPALREMLQTVVEIRRFAIDELGLPDNRSYTLYADLGRPYAVWNVVAAQEFSVDAERWCFPVAGCVAYRGFFRREAAERFQDGLDERGFDTYSGGVRAYSTLGYFADPVLNTMLVGGEVQIASLLFHELAHQRLYVKDDSAFSEAFASAVEEFGTERWLASRGDAAAIGRYRASRARRADFAQLIANQQQRLRDIYARGDPPEQLRVAKAEAFDQLRADYAALRQRWGAVADYDAWFAQPLNNATLAAVATYEGWLPALRWRLAEVGLERFYVDVERLADLPPEKREQWLRAWSAGRASPDSDAG
jgi:predicted aminopeptidase